MPLHDETTPTDINTPTPPDEPRAAPIAIPKPQQSITAAGIVMPDTTQVITTAPATQETKAPKAAGGNLIMQGTEGRPAPAVPMQQTQSAPQIITPISTLKTS